MAEADRPPGQQENPWVPPGSEPLVFDTFAGLNTNASRPGIEDQQMYWCNGWMPVGVNNLRTMPGINPVAIYTPPPNITIIWYDFANIGPAPIMIVLLSDGSLVQVNTKTKVITSIALAGTITSPSQIGIAITQWGNQYVVIVANQTNGYFIWDGTVFYSPGSIAPPVSVISGGSGFTSTPSINVTGGHGSGVSLLPVVTSSVVTSVSIITPGTGYKAGDLVTLTVGGGGGSGVSVSATLMPFGIQGTAAETYTDRVWVANGATINFTAPGVPTDFATSDGGGNFTSVDSFLRVGFTQLRQSNGFLYLIADSSINYISGVQTSGVPPTTTFTNQNADPEIGTPYAGTVDVLSRNIICANDFGVHVSYGGAVTKISEALDGVYNTVANSFGGFQPSACKAIVFGKRIWCLLIPVIDFVTNVKVNMLFVWDGRKWFSTQQDVALNFVQHQEINSVITAYGTNGSAIYALFQQPSIGFAKTVQSKLWDKPTYILMKTVSRLFGLANFTTANDATLTISVDNEQGISPTKYNFPETQMIWKNNAGNTMAWQNNTSQPMIWLIPGITAFAPQAIGQKGVLAGLTITTNCDDVSIVSMTMIQEIFQYLG